MTLARKFMKKTSNKVSIWLLMLAPMMFSCASTSYPINSSSNPSYSSPYFDFNPFFDGKRKLAEYRFERTFEHIEAGNFGGTLLNPRNYPEDTSTTPHYRSEIIEDENSSSTEPIDYSEEPIVFDGFKSVIADTITTFNHGQLGDTDIEELLVILNQNDDFANKQTTTFNETILHHGFFNDPYYAFNNSHKIETKSLTRYDNDIVHGTGEGTIYYQDGFKHDYTLVEQIRATGFLIYEMRDETFPSGSTSAKDYKRTSIRVAGNYQSALGLGGGARMQRFIERRIEEYGPFTDPESATYSPYYQYSITGYKGENETTLTFQLHIEQHVGTNNANVYEMQLVFGVTIEDGFITSERSHQVYWANLD